MIGLVDRLDALERLLDRKTATIYFHILGDEARHGAEAAGDAHRTDIGVRRQGAVEHARVEFVGFAVYVQEGTREMRPEQGRPQKRGAAEQFIDEMVFGTANGMRIEARLVEKELG